MFHLVVCSHSGNTDGTDGSLDPVYLVCSCGGNPGGTDGRIDFIYVVAVSALAVPTAAAAGDTSGTDGNLDIVHLNATFAEQRLGTSTVRVGKSGFRVTLAT